MRGQRARIRRKQAVFRWVVVAVIVTFFALPLLGMLEFTTRGKGGVGRSAQTWAALLDFPTIEADYPVLKEGFLASLGLAVVTVVIMLVLLVPTMTWVRLRLPGLTRTVEFICLLPLTVPAIVLVVGLTPVYRPVDALVGSATIWLSLAYVILVLPYAYRSIDAGLRAVDVKTLSEAGRSLGAGWPTVIGRIVLPNLRTAVLSASFLSVALVLGEYTIASLFARKNLQVAMYELGKSDAKISVAVGLASLAFAFVVLFGMSFIGNAHSGPSLRDRMRRPRKEPA